MSLNDESPRHREGDEGFSQVRLEVELLHVQRLPKQAGRLLLGGECGGDRVPELGRQLGRGLLGGDELQTSGADRPLGALDARGGSAHGAQRLTGSEQIVGSSGV